MHAVRGIDLDIEPGELVAVLGPNGAGKSTTMRMLTTLIAPPRGRRRSPGTTSSPSRGQVRRAIGYVGQGNGAGHNQRVARRAAQPGPDVRPRPARPPGAAPTNCSAALDLDRARGRKVSSLSGGQRRRLDVAMGLVHAPSLLFLDEPSTGLDPQNRANLWEHILPHARASTR